MKNTIQLFIDSEKKVKGYPITSPDRVIDDNGVSIKKRLQNNVKFDIVGDGEEVPELDGTYDDTEIVERIDNIAEQLVNSMKYNNTINLGKLGIFSENVSYNQSNKTYDMTDISNVINNAINNDCDTLIFPSGNFLIENTIVIDRALTLIGNGCNLYSSPSAKSKTIFKVTNSNV